MDANVRRVRQLFDPIRTQGARFGSAAVIVCSSQAISVISGVVCIRLLTIREYGVYVLGLAIIQMGILLTDLGVTGSATAMIAGASDRLGEMQRVRREMALLRGVLAVLWTAALLVGYPLYSSWRSSSASVLLTPLNATIIGASFLSMVWFHSEMALYRGIATSGKVAAMDLSTSLLRAVFAIGSILTVPTGIGGLSGVLLSYLAAAFAVSNGIRLQSRPNSDMNKIVAPGAHGTNDAISLRTKFAPLVLPSIFFAAQSYAVTFLMAQRGTLVDVAVYGAATRFTQAYSILSSINSAVLQPLVARFPSDTNWTATTALIVGLTACVIAVIDAAAWMLAPELVKILGPQYGTYTSLIPLAFIGASCYFLGSIVYGILIARGVTAGQWLTIPFGLTGMALAYVLLEPKTAHDFLLFEAIRCGAYLLCQLTLLISWVHRKNGERRISLTPQSAA
jgi:O-antigen/teichoic acid export membrane protein